MRLSAYVDRIKSLMPGIDLVDENEFHLFRNEDFARRTNDYFISEVRKIEENLKIKILFGFRNLQTFNASATKIQNENIVLINVGIVNRLEVLIDQFIDTFLSNESLIQFSLSSANSEVKELCTKLALNYLLYHEIAHILQLNYSK